MRKIIVAAWIILSSASIKLGVVCAYPMSRDASGTSWQPDSTPHEGLHLMRDDWMFMAHGFANGIYDHQGGPRGDDKAFSTSMLMLMAQRGAGPGTLSLRGMFSLDPAMGPFGYPLLLQTGETGDGRTPLIDRQHPHDFFMELAANYSVPIDEESSVFTYFGLPGEPALGPPVYMHRFSGMDDPEAPITHHWLDSTHISYGVSTLGLIWRDLKLEGSVFTGREPDERRWDMDSPRFDSQAIRLSVNPTRNWALEASYGHIVSPEQLEPGVDQERVTASAIYNERLGSGNWQTTFAWGEDRNHPGRALDAFLFESAVSLRYGQTFFGRVERVDKDELFEAGDPRAGMAFTVNKLSFGTVYDFAEVRHARWSVGGVGSLHFLPGAVRPAYGGGTPGSFILFVRVKLI